MIQHGKGDFAMSAALILSDAFDADSLRRMGYVRISGRPQHPEQKPEVIDAFKKTSPQRWQRM
ncbi:winged helix-turn-helix domain-containing protein [Cohaesibacter sp. ES.047]|uniref:winged helix-turn-helix domain-containing protein n=1 Tax=Cohaesibacter sp. ES.047 TaxID=1798205 RepID=UPI0012FD8E66